MLGIFGRNSMLDKGRSGPYCPPEFNKNRHLVCVMKIANSLKTLKTRDRNCRVIKRRGRVYVINKKNKRFKARQG